MEIVLETKDFINAILRLTPKRVRNVTKSEDVAIFVSNKMFIFSTRQLVTECPLIKETWRGCVLIKFNVLRSFCLAPPTTPTILITFADKRVKIANLSLQADWMEAPPWIPTKKV